MYPSYFDQFILSLDLDYLGMSKYNKPTLSRLMIHKLPSLKHEFPLKTSEKYIVPLLSSILMPVLNRVLINILFIPRFFVENFERTFYNLVLHLIFSPYYLINIFKRRDAKL